MFKITNFSQKSSSIPHFSTLKKHYFLATLSLPFLLLSQTTIISAQPTNLKNGHSNLELGVSPSEIAQDLVTKHLDNNNKLLSDNYDSSEAADFSTGFEDLDYWALELELAQEMVRLNKQKKFIEDQNELRKKMINSEVSVGSRKGVDINSQKLNTWQATEGVVDALIRSGIQENKSKTVKRAASKSVEQRMLSAKYNRRGGAQNFESSDSNKPQQMSPDVRLDEAGVRNEEQKTPSRQQQRQQVSTASPLEKRPNFDFAEISHSDGDSDFSHHFVFPEWESTQKTPVKILESSNNNAIVKSHIIDKLKTILRQ